MGEKGQEEERGKLRGVGFCVWREYGEVISLGNVEEDLAVDVG